MTPQDIARELSVCEQRQSEIMDMPLVMEGHAPAWLVTLGLLDWEMEKELIIKGVSVKATF
jgi:hypothetical protein